MSVESAGPGLGAKILIALALALASYAAPAAACGVGETMIFFDRGSTEIRRDQAERLDGFVAQVQGQDESGRIAVSGFTDTLGSAAANLDLARRRAEAVRFYLDGHGVPAGLIDLNPFGEAGMLLPTPDGVDEPQNRRVTLLVRAGTDEGARRRAEREARRRAQVLESGGALPLC